MNDYWNKSEHTIEEKKLTGAQYYTERKKGNPRDWWSFTKDQDADLLPGNFDRNKKNIAIFNSSMFEYGSVSPEWNYGFFNTQEEFISS